RPHSAPGKAGGLCAPPRGSPCVRNRKRGLDVELDLHLKAGGVTGRPEPLLVEHPAAVQFAQHEPAAAGTQLRIDLERDLPRRPRCDVGSRHSSNPKEKSSPKASSAIAIRFKARTSGGASVVANATRTGAAAIGIAKWTSMTVTPAR